MATKFVFHLLIISQIIAYSLAIGPISQCAGGLFETDLFGNSNLYLSSSSSSSYLINYRNKIRLMVNE